MKQFFSQNVRAVAAVIVVIVAVISLWYVISSREPALGSYAVQRGDVPQAIDEPGTVATENNASISFQEPGRVTYVYVKEGDTVAAGQALADLDAASLMTGVQQANGALAAAQAKLDALQTGATSQTIAVSQTALTSAEQSLANSYSGVPNILNDAYTKANDAVRTQLAAFFSNPESVNAQLTFTINDSQVLANIQSARVSASAELNAWQKALTNVAAGSGADTLDATIQSAAQHLTVAQSLMNLSITALTGETGLAALTVATYKTSATTGLNEVNAAVTEVSNAEQAIASEKAAVAQAQAGLNLTTASSTSQTIAEQQAAVQQAQAALAAAQVALSEASLVAPFPGTVQDLTAQVGEVVSPGMPVLSLVNSNGLKIQTYVSELDVAKASVGNTAEVTLDAFGASASFPATVTAVDSAETVLNGVPSYLVTLHFTQLEPQVKVGMTGNVHLILAEDNNVLAVPSRLVLNDGNQNFVLIKSSGGIERQPVQIGLVGANGTTEITSGLNEGDTLVNF